MTYIHIPIAAIISNIGAFNNHITVHKALTTVVSPVIATLISGIIVHRVHRTTMSHATAHTTSIIFAIKSELFVAHVVNCCISGCIVVTNLENAGARAHPIVSFKLPIDTAITSFQPATVLLYQSACPAVFCITIANASCAVVHSFTSIPNSLRTLVCPACTLISVSLASASPIPLYLAKSIARLFKERAFS